MDVKDEPLHPNMVSLFYFLLRLSVNPIIKTIIAATKIGMMNNIVMPFIIKNEIHNKAPSSFVTASFRAFQPYAN